MKTRSAILLKAMVDRGGFTRDEMAEALVVSGADVDAFIEGRKTMSLAHQLCLALHVIRNAPALARRGHTLRAQVAAQLAVQSGATTVHSQPHANAPPLKARKPLR